MDRDTQPISAVDDRLKSQPATLQNMQVPTNLPDQPMRLRVRFQKRAEPKDRLAGPVRFQSEDRRDFARNRMADSISKPTRLADVVEEESKKRSATGQTTQRHRRGADGRDVDHEDEAIAMEDDEAVLEDQEKTITKRFSRGSEQDRAAAADAEEEEHAGQSLALKRRNRDSLEPNAADETTMEEDITETEKETDEEDVQPEDKGDLEQGLEEEEDAEGDANADMDAEVDPDMAADMEETVHDSDEADNAEEGAEDSVSDKAHGKAGRGRLRGQDSAAAAEERQLRKPEQRKAAAAKQRASLPQGKSSGKAGAAADAKAGGKEGAHARTQQKGVKQASAGAGKGRAAVLGKEAEKALKGRNITVRPPLLGFNLTWEVLVGEEQLYRQDVAAAAPALPLISADQSGSTPVSQLTAALAKSRSRDGIVIVTWASAAYLDFMRNWVHHLTLLEVENFLIGTCCASACLSA